MNFYNGWSVSDGMYLTISQIAHRIIAEILIERPEICNE